MSILEQRAPSPGRSFFDGYVTWGMGCLLVATLAAGVFFADGLDALLVAWQQPEYSHGPLIPVLSLLLFLRQLRSVPVNTTAYADKRWTGLVLIVLAVLVGTLGKLSNINDFVAYATIIWIGGVLLVSFGWSTGKHFWPPVLHLVYMLPLPAVIYYKMTTWLQFISSELGVWFLKLLSIPVFLDGNIIDLGPLKLHVAEACSGLRYLFPILSFSYIFAVLYRGPTWHKAVLLISAVPITVLMNSVRIAIGGYIANKWGVEWLEGFSHFFEGWVIFLACILILFGLARLMLVFNPVKMTLVDALDLETDGLLAQAARLRYVRASAAMVTTALIMLVAVAAWEVRPERGSVVPERDSFALFPRQLGAWKQVGQRQLLETAVEEALGADDYHQIDLFKPGEQAHVQFFTAWYKDQSQGGVHSPEICLPGGGWEIAWLERTDISGQLGSDTPFNVNRAIIQKGESRMMVLYWFEQKGRKVAWDFAARFYLMWDGVATGRTDGALIRLTTPMRLGESEAEAKDRLMEVVREIRGPLPRFIPEV